MPTIASEIERKVIEDFTQDEMLRERAEGLRALARYIESQVPSRGLAFTDTWMFKLTPFQAAICSAALQQCAEGIWRASTKAH